MGASGPMESLLRRRDAVSPVVAELLLVAITVVLAAVLYLMASGLLGSEPNILPTVAFTSVEGYPAGSYNSTFAIADASRAEAIAKYKFTLQVGAVLGPVTLFATSSTAADVTVNGTAYRVIWLDSDGGGSLTQGDEIKVTGRGVSLPAATSLDFHLIWSDGSQITHEAWTTP